MSLNKLAEEPKVKSVQELDPGKEFSKWWVGLLFTQRVSSAFCLLGSLRHSDRGPGDWDSASQGEDKARERRGSFSRLLRVHTCGFSTRHALFCIVTRSHFLFLTFL